MSDPNKDLRQRLFDLMQGFVTSDEDDEPKDDTPTRDDIESDLKSLYPRKGSDLLPNDDNNND